MELGPLIDMPMASRPLPSRPVVETQTKTAAAQGLSGKMLLRKTLTEHMASDPRAQGQALRVVFGQFDTKYQTLPEWVCTALSLLVKFHAKQGRVDEVRQFKTYLNLQR